MRKIIVILLSFALVLGNVSQAFAHQPYFEDTDTTSALTISIADPLISTALYGTLESPTDVDYYTFQGRAGSAVLLGMSIPDIVGQENFAPMITLMGPGLQQSTAPAQLRVPADQGTVTVQASNSAPQVFFEPYSRTSYWRRQRQTITLPADGLYTVMVWSDVQMVGRYSLVVGEREVRGGDPAFSSKIASFWTPVIYTPPTAVPALPTSIPPTPIPPTPVPPTPIPPTPVPPTPVPPTPVPPTPIPPTLVPPTPVPTTPVLPTFVPPTPVPPTSIFKQWAEKFTFW